MVRTKVLMFAAAALLCLTFAYRGAAWWWLLACIALPLWAGVAAVQAVLRAWPVDQRQVSIVRAAMAAIAGFAVLREVFGPPRFPPLRAVASTLLGVAAVVAVLAFYNLGRPQFWDNEQREPTPILLGLCVAQYWTVLVTDLRLHFHLATVLLFAALTAIVIVSVRADVREGRLDFLARFFGAAGPVEREPAKAAAVETAPSG